VTQQRGPTQGLKDLADLLAEEQPRMSTFLRGLTIGALVGAAIAGSTLWSRRRRRRTPPEPPSG
jgi:hypothetical protein